MTMKAPDLRAYSDALWSAPEIEAACLALQRDFGADVNLVLVALYLAALGRAADAETIAGARAVADEWTPTIIMPLRAARRALKTRDADLHARAKALELDAEWAMQARLQSVADIAPPSGADDPYAANLAALVGAEAAHSAPAQRLMDAVPRVRPRL